MNTRAKKRTNEEWRQVILEARNSGLSDYEYCRINTIPPSTFYRAIKRLRRLSCDIPAGVVTQDRQKQEVVPINLSDLPLTKPDHMQPVSGVVCDSMTAPLETTMRITIGGSTLELSNNADPMLIGSVLRMLNRSC